MSSPQVWEVSGVCLCQQSPKIWLNLQTEELQAIQATTALTVIVSKKDFHSSKTEEPILFFFFLKVANEHKGF